MYRGGLRAGEALALRPKDLDTTAGTLTVLHGKGDRRRVVGLDPGAMAILSRWLETRHTLGINGHAPLFCTLQGKPLQPSYVRTLMPPREQGPHRETRSSSRPPPHPCIRVDDGRRTCPDHPTTTRTHITRHHGPLRQPPRTRRPDLTHAATRLDPLERVPELDR